MLYLIIRLCDNLLIHLGYFYFGTITQKQLEVFYTHFFHFSLIGVVVILPFYIAARSYQDLMCSVFLQCATMLSGFHVLLGSVCSYLLPVTVLDY